MKGNRAIERGSKKWKGGTMKGNRAIERGSKKLLKYYVSVKFIGFVLRLSEGLRIMSVGKPEVKIYFMGLGSRWLANVGNGLDKYGTDIELHQLKSAN
jgi:hypothetical protein